MARRTQSLLSLIIFLFSVASNGQAAKIRLFAASSLTDVLPRVAAAWRRTHPDVQIELSFDASSKLAKQIEQGAPADMFFPADTEWMDYLENKGLIVERSRHDILHNEMVWIVPAGSTQAPQNLSDPRIDGYSKIGMAGENVPIAKYAKAAMEKHGIWKKLKNKIIRGDNVRTTLKWVSDNEVEAGVVYRTDALANPKVKIAFVFPKEAHSKVTYPIAILKKSGAKVPNQEATLDHFITFLSSKEAKLVFNQTGFH